MKYCANHQHPVPHDEKRCPTCFSDDIGLLCDECDTVMIEDFCQYCHLPKNLKRMVLLHE